MIPSATVQGQAQIHSHCSCERRPVLKGQLQQNCIPFSDNGPVQKLRLAQIGRGLTSDTNYDTEAWLTCRK